MRGQKREECKRESREESTSKYRHDNSSNKTNLQPMSVVRYLKLLGN
jgi:hypothetical protein